MDDFSNSIQKGTATVFAAYSDKGRAEQAIFHAALTPFFKRRDWMLDKVVPQEPLVAPRTAATEKGPRPQSSGEEPESGTRVDLATAWRPDQEGKP